ncbi:MAG: alpha-amylase family glycosyl hydrolase [Anaerolineales bacterium]
MSDATYCPLDDRVLGPLAGFEGRLARYREERRGVRHGQRLTPVLPQPGTSLTLHVTTGGRPFDAVEARFTCDGSDPCGPTARPLPFESVAPAWDTLEWRYLQRWEATLPPQPEGTWVRYRVRARATGTGRWLYADNQAVEPTAATPFAFSVEGPAPAWSRAALVYQIFLDRFYPGEGRAWRQRQDLFAGCGGTLRGVLDRLDYLADLGVDVLWLSPVFASPSYHGYDATDLLTVEPRLGSNAELQALIDAAHARGLRVLLDFVANHWSDRHPTFVEARRDPGSPYRSWYTWGHDTGDYACYFGVRTMPELNLAPGPAREHVIAAATHWLERGVDGYRLDHAGGPSRDFWSAFRRACRAVRPDCWLFGELPGAPADPLGYGGVLDGALDFLLNQALRETFARRRWSLATFDAFLQAHERAFPPGFSRPAFLDNHDMNRFRFQAGDDLAALRLAALVLYTLSGPPILYYGTETGLSQQHPIHRRPEDFGTFEEARLPLPWEDLDGALLDYFRRLGALRRAHPVLHEGRRETVHLDPDLGTYAYRVSRGDDEVVVALNLDAAPHHLALPGLGRVAARDRLGDLGVRSAGGALALTLPPRSGAFIS